MLLLIFNVILLLTFPRIAYPTKIIFGSCSKVDKPQPLWKFISSRKPAVFAWLGDNIYADVLRDDYYKYLNIFSGKGDGLLPPGERPRFRARTKEEHENMYNKQKQVSDYKSLSASTKIIGTWDDHDCGINDADKHFSKKKERMGLHLDFLDVPKDDPRRSREGVYTSHIVDNRVKVILLDVRYNRDPWPWHSGAQIDYANNGDILGEEQWSWLEDQLTKTDIDSIELTLVGSGIQVLPIVELIRGKHETWVQFSESRKRLISLLSKSETPVMLLSGDVHFAEFSEAVCTTTGADNNDNGRKAQSRLIEFTSSGLTHAWAGPLSWPKPMPAAVLSKCLWYLWDFVGIHSHRVDAYPGLNFGEIEFPEGSNFVVLRAIGASNKTELEMTVNLNELLGGSGNSDVVTNQASEKIECAPRNGVTTEARIKLSIGMFVIITIFTFGGGLLFIIMLLFGMTAGGNRENL